MKRIILLSLVFILIASAVPAFAQAEPVRMATLTEQQINESFRIENPRAQIITAQMVDLQPGLVVIQTTLSPRRGQPFTLQTTLAPSLNDGNILWVVTGITDTEGNYANDEMIEALNTLIQNAWRQYFRQQTDRFAVTGLEITDTQINYTLEGPLRPEIPGQANTVILTEQQINDTYRIQNNALMRVEDITVDLQAGQVMVTAQIITEPEANPIIAILIGLAHVENNRVFWTVTDVTVEGVTASDEMIERINQLFVNSWQHYLRLQTGQGRVESLEITDDAMTFTLTARR